MKRLKRLLGAILCICTVLTVIPCISVEAETDAYAQSLRDEGFPDDYVELLCDLHDLHPAWVFKADKITELSREHKTSTPYTWNYVKYMEYDYVESRNLISPYYAQKEPAYSKNENKYDSGIYPASEACVEFFLDPRNFLNEYDVFQFEVLEYNDSMTPELLESTLSGTFMADTVIPGDDNTEKLTYAEYIVKIAQELNLSALQIASRLRNEQGVAGTNPLISGTCGDNLWELYSEQAENAPTTGYNETQLKSYNGYYNFFNMDASGSGYFNIRLAGMNEAKNAGWDTRMKAIRGGAEKYRARYIEQQQYTPYYFKFNVRPGTNRNFWGQYMQSIPGAYSDGRNMQKAYAKLDLLDNVHTFYIPVFDGMPEAPTSDPGTAFSNKQEYKTSISTPSLGMASSKPMTYSVEKSASDTLELIGWSVHTDGVSSYKYSIDGGDFVELNGLFDRDVYESTRGSYANSRINSFNDKIPLTGLSDGMHNIVVKGVSPTGSSFYIADIDVILTASSVDTEAQTTAEDGSDTVSSSEDKNEITWSGLILPIVIVLAVIAVCAAAYVLISEKVKKN